MREAIFLAQSISYHAAAISSFRRSDSRPKTIAARTLWQRKISASTSAGCTFLPAT